MAYTHLVEPDVPSPGRVSLHVAAGTPEGDVARAGYQVLLEHDPVDLLVDDLFAGLLTLRKVLPLVLTTNGTVRGDRARGPNQAGVPEATRFRCPGCGAVAYVLGPGAARCRAGHGPMVRLPG